MNIKLYLSNVDIHKKESQLIKILINKNINSNIERFLSTVYYKKSKKTILEEGFCINIFDTNKKTLLVLWRELRKTLKIQCIYIESGKYKGCMAKIFKNENIKCSQSKEG